MMWRKGITYFEQTHLEIAEDLLAVLCRHIFTDFYQESRRRPRDQCEHPREERHRARHVQVAAVRHVTIVPSPCCVCECRNCRSSGLTCSLRGGRTATDTWVPRPPARPPRTTQFNTNLWRRSGGSSAGQRATAGVSLKADKVLMERIKCK